MAEVTFHIADPQAWIDTMVGREAIPTDIETQEPLFTPAQWAKERVKRWALNERRKYKLKLQEQATEPESDFITY